MTKLFLKISHQIGLKVALLAVIVLASLLRLWNLSDLPPALYWEEAALGYDAYSISTTLHDHHGRFLPIVAFESFGDWKPAGYFYAVALAIKVWGAVDFVVRLPAALAGVSMVLAVPLLLGLLGPKKLSGGKLLVSAGVTAILPWAIIFSRAAWEVNLATAFLTWGSILFLWGIKPRFKLGSQLMILSVSALFLAAAAYTYHATRLVAPLWGVGLVTYYLVEIKLNAAASLRKQWVELMPVLWFGLVSSLLFLPFLWQLSRPELLQRFNETSILAGTELVTQSNFQRELDHNSIVSRLFAHRLVLLWQQVLGNFLAHFRLDFLFINGDINPRHSVQLFGQFYYSELLAILVGLWWWVKQKTKREVLLGWMLMAGILPAALTTSVPHALRLLPTLAIWVVLITDGWWWLIQWFKANFPQIKLVLIGGWILSYLIQLGWFWSDYTLIYPRLYQQEWQYGYQQLVSELANIADENPELSIFVSREYGRPAIYWWWYLQASPIQVQTEDAFAQKDQGEFLTYGNVTFFDKVDQINSSGLVAASPRTLSQFGPSLPIVATVFDLNGKPVWQIVRMEK